MQRAGKTYRAAPGDNTQDMKLKNFFRTCKELLDIEGMESESFLFEQLEEHMLTGKPLPSEPKEISRLLGL